MRYYVLPFTVPELIGYYRKNTLVLTWNKSIDLVAADWPFPTWRVTARPFDWEIDA